MAQNGFGRRASHATRTYPGAASRLVGSSPGLPPSPPPPVPSTTGRVSSSSLGNVPSVFVRPLSRSQLVPMTGGVSSPPSPPARPISLDQPRPNAERHRNLYLGAPLPSHGPQIQQQIHSSRSQPVNGSGSSKNRLDSSITAAEQVRLGSSGSSSMTRSFKSDKSHPSTEESVGVVTSQPIKRGLLDESTESGKVKLAESSIVCPYCRKCRCEACTTPRPLPSKWICSKSIHCGPEPLLDYVTCLCCVKAVFYHCGKNHESDGGVICADKPCSCAPHRKFWRWGCMATMSLVLPCLCLYWPCKGCIHVAEKTYQRYHSGNGCNCHPVGGSTKAMDGAGGGHEEGRASSDFHGRSTSVGTVRMPTTTGNGGSSKLLPSSP